jgi:plasmid stabilization system protein ParE
MNLKFLTPAQAELLDAVNYYNAQSEGLGYEFALEVRRTIERIIQYPEAWPQISQRTRRCRTNRFPYGVIYQIGRENLLIVAVMHLSRNPQSWTGRVKE